MGERDMALQLMQATQRVEQQRQRIAELEESVRLFKLDEQHVREDLDAIYETVIGHTTADAQDIETTVGAVVDAIETLVRERDEVRDKTRSLAEAATDLLDDSWRHTVDWGDREEREKIEAALREAIDAAREGEGES